MKDFNRAYSDERFAPLYEPTRRVMAVMGKAMWHFAALKEITWYQWGFAGITGAVHYLEHLYPEYIDGFKDVLAQTGRPIPYPAIPEMTESFTDLPGLLFHCLTLIDEVNAALSDFIEATDTSDFEPLARQAESIQIENYKNRAWLEQAITMSHENGSVPTVDSWLKSTLGAPQKA